MKLKKKIAAILFAVLILTLAVSVAAACGEEETPVEPGGVLTYAGSVLPAATVGKNYVGSVATAKGAASIAYALKAGSSLPEGMTISRTGRLGGTPTAAAEDVKFTVVASAEGVESAEAEFTISVETPSLSYRGTMLADATIGAAYEYSVATASGAEKITYALAADSELPEGMTLSENGTVGGTPSAAVDNATFEVIASADGFDPVAAEFTVSVYYPSFVFEAEWALAVNGGGMFCTPRNGSSGNGFVDFKADHNNNSSIRLDFRSDKAGAVKVSMCMGMRADKKQSLGDVFNIKVNEHVNTNNPTLPTGSSWWDWRTVRVFETEIEAGANFIEIASNGDNALNLDYIRIEVMNGQTLCYGDCTETYAGERLTVLGTSVKEDVAASFGEGWTVETVYDMNEFSGGNLGTARRDISDDLDGRLGAYDLLVTASKGEVRKSLILPVEIVVSRNMHDLEAEGKTAVIAVGQDRDGKTATPTKGYDSNPSGGGYVDFHGGGSVTFTFTSNMATTAELFVTLGLRELSFAMDDIYSISVNGVPIDLGGITVPKNRPSTAAWKDWYDVSVGNIGLVEGENTIVVDASGKESPQILDKLTLAFGNADAVVS